MSNFRPLRTSPKTTNARGATAASPGFVVSVGFVRHQRRSDPLSRDVPKNNPKQSNVLGVHCS